MTAESTHPWLHRLAISTVCVALVTLTFGALVTSKNAGMAFPDWPTSDGYLMVTYPWLRDFAKNWDKFLEHGHRLAGMLIGLWSIGLVVATVRIESRGWVRWLAGGILLGVICQGVLGGFRVQLDARGLAMLHGIFAAIVFTLMGTMVLVTGRTWQEIRFDDPVPALTGARALAGSLVAFTVAQYVLGSFIRHQGTGLHEHYGLGLTVLVLSFLNLLALATGVPWLKRSAWLVLAVTLTQVVLGLISWGVKYGIPSWGYVATAGSALQVLMRTAHMVWGTITIMTISTYGLKVFRVAAVAPRPLEPVIELRSPAAIRSQGGAG
jgi:cytochrome c oxidase assembly protein subunit 15